MDTRFTDCIGDCLTSCDKVLTVLEDAFIAAEEFNEEAAATHLAKARNQIYKGSAVLEDLLLLLESRESDDDH